ncbi:MAG: acyltransferase [Tatlockia sp.]|nr:acyltransferase [Tatlockia sp.]
MNKSKNGWYHGLLAILLLSLTTIICFIPILLIGFLKLFPNQHLKVLCTKWVDSIASLWSSINNYYISQTQKTNWEISGLSGLNKNNWYLLVANHQSWLDIVVLQRILNRKIPMMKFFIKDQLKWVPLLGFAWWAMGCPFMKRYSKDYLAKNPQKKGKDLLATQKAVQSFQYSPVTIMNFIEGTRFTSNKSQQQQSPYQHLLKPKAGGISFVISSMGKKFASLLDVTIVYSEKDHSLWDFLCKRVKTIKVHVRELPIPEEFFTPSLVEDNEIQSEFRDWLNNYWQDKDQLIASLKT